MRITKQESRVLLGQIFYSKEQGMDDDWMEGYLIEQIERLSKLHQHDVIKNEVAVCEHSETENLYCDVGWAIEGKRCKKCKQTVL